MPLAAVISDKIFCVHGGLSPNLRSLEDISDIKRPLSLDGSSGLAIDLLWSDPVS
jgi:serine/threonine-protein phosphatase PP1 catalytic subunit